jgi:hypothetical protein
MGLQAKKVRKLLERGLRSGALVRIRRTVEPASAKGYVLDIGPRWFLLTVVGDDIRYRGFEAYRLRDVSEIDVPDEYAGFIEYALKLRGEERPPGPPVSVARTRELLATASAAFPLITIHREGVDPDVCWIGQVVRQTDRCVVLREIGPDASWDPKLRKHRRKEITRVDFGGPYEDALWSVNEAALLKPQR